jgi:hypothetical protein
LGGSALESVDHALVGAVGRFLLFLVDDDGGGIPFQK